VGPKGNTRLAPWVLSVVQEYAMHHRAGEEGVIVDYYDSDAQTRAQACQLDRYTLPLSTDVDQFVSYAGIVFPVGGDVVVTSPAHKGHCAGNPLAQFNVWIVQNHSS